MNEKSYFEIIEDYAKEQGIKYYTSKKVENHLLHPGERFTSKKFIVFELDKEEKTFFVFFDSFAPKAYTSNTYCGIFKKTSKCINEVKIVKRDWFDALAFRKRLKTRDNFLNKNITIYSENDKIDSSLINNRIIREFMDLNKIVQPLELITEREAISVVPELNGLSLVALKTNNWIVDFGELNSFIEKGSKILRGIK